MDNGGIQALWQITITKSWLVWCMGTPPPCGVSGFKQKQTMSKTVHVLFCLDFLCCRGGIQSHGPYRFPVTEVVFRVSRFPVPEHFLAYPQQACVHCVLLSRSEVGTPTLFSSCYPVLALALVQQHVLKKRGRAYSTRAKIAQTYALSKIGQIFTLS